MILKPTLDFGSRFESVFGISFKDAQHWLVYTVLNLVLAAVILIIGWWIAKWTGKIVKKLLTKSKTDQGLITFLTSMVIIVVKIFVIVSAITQLGFQMTSFITILGAAGLAIGMAFSGTLSNFAGGVMILLFKPFKVGDTIATLTHQGKVQEIQIFYSFILTSDNKMVVMPNGPLANGTIVNFTKEGKRRVDLALQLHIKSDFTKVYSLIDESLKSNDMILKDPVHFIGIKGIHKDHLEITVRAWAKTDEYWDVHFYITQTILPKLVAENCIISE